MRNNGNQTGRGGYLNQQKPQGGQQGGQFNNQSGRGNSNRGQGFHQKQKPPNKGFRGGGN
jgi:hypothetical protein